MTPHKMQKIFKNQLFFAVTKMQVLQLRGEHPKKQKTINTQKVTRTYMKYKATIELNPYMYMASEFEKKFSGEFVVSEEDAKILKDMIAKYMEDK